MIRQLLVVAILALGSVGFLQAACADGGCAAPTSECADVAVADLKTAITGKTVVLVDANGTASFTKGHLPGAIDFESSKADLAKKLPADKAALIVAYCGGPKCGAWKDAAGAIAALGYTNVKHFSGGLKGWQEAGEKLEATPQ